MLRSQDLGDCAPPVREGPRVRPNREMDGLPIPRRYWAIAAISFGTALFSGKPKALWLIDSGFNLIAFVIAGVILAGWR